MQRIFRFLLDSDDRPLFGKLARLMWLGAFGVIIATVALFIGLSFTDLPSVEQLENPKSELATQVFASDGSVLGRYYFENRVPVNYEDLSPHLISALIATEDERYETHSGIDFKALSRTMVKTVILGQRSAGGASTITQQLAKLLFTDQMASSLTERAFQKLKEWIIAIRLERRYTKQEIIAMYLNKFEFINGAFGIKAASEIYFDKAQDSLEMHEAAMFVGMLKNPNLFNPFRFRDTVLHRRMVVFSQMKKNGMISQAEYDSLRTLPLGLKPTRQTHIDGPAPYFRMELAKYIKNILSQSEYKKADGSSYNIYRDGLKIYTTIDPEMQKIAEEVMSTNTMPKVQKAFFNVWKGMDPWRYKSDAKTELSVKFRLAQLKKLIRSSERYQTMRSKYLTNVTSAINKDFPDFMFHDDDREIERLVQESDGKKVINQLLREKLIGKNLAAKYRKVLKSPHFPKLKEQWNRLQEKVDEDFNKPTKMRVFAYNTQFEKDTTMSPLDSVKYHRMFLQTGILAVDPKTGYVKVWVGGINHKYFQYDHVNINRQVGSTFKPFVYAAAINFSGLSPCYLVDDVPVTISPGYGQFYLNEPWTPNNSKGEYSYKTYTLKDALAKSINTTSAYLMKELRSPEPVRDLVHEMGIDKTERYPNGRYRVPKAPSIALGATDLSVLEMTGAYTTFANNGIYNKPVFVTKIEDKNGRVIYEEIPEERVALPPNVNYVMVDMLKYSGSSGMWGINSQVGGKTGTTNDYVDGWYMGITPNLVVGTWVGGEDRWIRFRNITYGQGAYMAKPFFREFMKRLEASPTINWDKKATFYRPPGDLQIELDCDTYQNDTWSTDEDGFDEAFLEQKSFSDDIFADEIPADYQEEFAPKGVDTTKVKKKKKDIN